MGIWEGGGGVMSEPIGARRTVGARLILLTLRLRRRLQAGLHGNVSNLVLEDSVSNLGRGTGYSEISCCFFFLQFFSVAPVGSTVVS